jgi:hypothetical protein
MPNCKSCGAEITWAPNQEGTNVPLSLDPKGDWVIVPPNTVSGGSVAVRVSKPDGYETKVQMMVEKGQRFHSHLKDCPDAHRWRKKP